MNGEAPPGGPVLIVGAGPTGLLLAAELRRRGIECRLVDEKSGPMHWDRATVVHPRSLEVFEALGLIDRFLEVGAKQRSARIHSHGQLLGEIDLSICGSRHGFNLGLSEEVTESILEDHLHAHGGRVERSSRVVAMKPRADGVTAMIEGDGGVDEAEFQWVVGCDGLHSVVRQQGGIDVEGREIEAPWAVFDASLRNWPESYEANFVYLDQLPVILTALPGRRWRVYLRPSSAESDLERDAAGTLHRYHPQVAFEGVENPRRFHCHTKVAARFRAGRMLLAGDAAHVCSPAEGHGMNSGIQDAFNLAWKLALVVDGHSDPELLDSYELERRPVAEMVTQSGEATEHAQTLATDDERRARDAQLRGVYADPTSRHHEAVAEAELNIDYAGSPIVTGEPNGALGPGARVANTVEVTRPDGRPGFLHELLGVTGHTVLLVGGPGTPVDELASLEDRLSGVIDRSLVERALVATAGETAGRWTQLDGRSVGELGVAGVTLFVVRPDRHVGARADRDHVRALVRYQQLLAARRTPG
jgi:2-polyprenyl-6-methoxyphenol hydroxylase-like FAD-dependent oxidoreductase